MKRDLGEIHENPKDSKKAILETQWTVTLHPLAERELRTIPADMQARFLHIGEMLEELGPQRVGLPHIRPLESKLWEMRMTGRDGVELHPNLTQDLHPILTHPI